MRLKLTVAYHGASFSGWQSQADGNGVQDHMEAAFQRLLKRSVRVHGSGRTDAGVHALAQVAHADVDQRPWPPPQWVRALNANLPSALRVLMAKRVPPTFHARHSARSKLYRYRIWAAGIPSPFEADRAWYIAEPFDFNVFAQTAQRFPGEHDFAAFAASRGKKEDNTVRTIRAVRTRKDGPAVIVEFEGDGFLYKMVRLMVGALVRCATGRLDPLEVEQRLRHPKRPHPRLVAPAHGLYLARVRY